VLCTDHGGIQHAQEQIENHLDRARETLRPFEYNDGSDMLRRIVEDLRTYAGNQVAGFQTFASREQDFFRDPRSASLG
jgi:hypothetical protein